MRSWLTFTGAIDNNRRGVRTATGATPLPVVRGSQHLAYCVRVIAALFESAASLPRSFFYASLWLVFYAGKSGGTFCPFENSEAATCRGCLHEHCTALSLLSFGFKTALGGRRCSTSRATRLPCAVCVIGQFKIAVSSSGVQIFNRMERCPRRRARHMPAAFSRARSCARVAVRREHCARREAAKQTDCRRRHYHYLYLYHRPPLLGKLLRSRLAAK